MNASGQGQPPSNEELQLAIAKVERAEKAAKAAKDKVPLAKRRHKAARRAFKQTKKLAKKAAKLLRQARKQLKALVDASRESHRSPTPAEPVVTKARKRPRRATPRSKPDRRKIAAVSPDALASPPAEPIAVSETTVEAN